MGSRLVPAGRRFVSGERAYSDHLLSGPALSADLYRICSQKDQGESLWRMVEDLPDYGRLRRIGRIA